MSIRERFEQKLAGLRDDVLAMGSAVGEQLEVAMTSLYNLNVDLARQVYVMDLAVNKARFDIEEKAFALIVTQQPAAGDLRAIVAVMNMIVDLERMGDHAKGVAKVVTYIYNNPARKPPPQLKQMGEMVTSMLRQTMNAYANNNVELARFVAKQDDEIDQMYGMVFSQVMAAMAKTKKAAKVETNYEFLRVARELERFGDLSTNIAERVVYRVTGSFDEINRDMENSEK